MRKGKQALAATQGDLRLDDGNREHSFQANGAGSHSPAMVLKAHLPLLAACLEPFRTIGAAVTASSFRRAASYGPAAMTLTLSPPATAPTEGFMPRILVVGVGGGGGNAVNNMIRMGLEGVEFVVANTDGQSLSRTRADTTIHLGAHLTQGLGAGGRPEIGRAAAEEAADDIARRIEGAHIVFITAGMGGGTGTGAASVIARIAAERGALTIGVVTRPFNFEGKKRAQAADEGILELQRHVDTLIVVPNQNLFRMATQDTTFADAFRMADNVLFEGVRGVSDLMVRPGLVNLDYADVRTAMIGSGRALMGTGEAEGDGRALRAADLAINNPLLEDDSLKGARALIVSVSGGSDLTLFELDEAVNRVAGEIGEDLEVFFGTSLDEGLNGRIRVTVVATGIGAPVAAAQPRTPAPVAVEQPAPTPQPPRPAQPGQPTQPGQPPRPARLAEPPPARTEDLNLPTFLRRQRNG